MITKERQKEFMVRTRVGMVKRSFTDEECAVYYSILCLIESGVPDEKVKAEVERLRGEVTKTAQAALGIEKSRDDWAIRAEKAEAEVAQLTAWLSHYRHDRSLYVDMPVNTASGQGPQYDAALKFREGEGR
jgi:hypothetical protein